MNFCLDKTKDRVGPLQTDLCVSRGNPTTTTNPTTNTTTTTTATTTSTNPTTSTDLCVQGGKGTMPAVNLSGAS